MSQKRQEYVAPKFAKCDQLEEVAAGAAITVSGQGATPKGGCFKNEDDAARDLRNG